MSPGVVFVANVKEYGTGFALTRLARPDDGLLDVCVIPGGGRAGRPGHFLRAAAGEHLLGEGVIYARGKQIDIESAAPPAAANRWRTGRPHARPSRVASAARAVYRAAESIISQRFDSVLTEHQINHIFKSGGEKFSMACMEPGKNCEAWCFASGGRIRRSHRPPALSPQGCKRQMAGHWPRPGKSNRAGNLSDRSSAGPHSFRHPCHGAQYTTAAKVIS